MAKSKPYHLTLIDPNEKIRGLTSQVIELIVIYVDFEAKVIRIGKPYLIAVNKSIRLSNIEFGFTPLNPLNKIAAGKLSGRNNFS